MKSYEWFFAESSHNHSIIDVLGDGASIGSEIDIKQNEGLQQEHLDHVMSEVPSFALKVSG